MARRKTLTDAMIAKMKPEEKRLTKPDPELLGHYIRVTPKGAKSYVAVARAPGGKQVWTTLGSTDHYSIAEARSKPGRRSGASRQDSPPSSRRRSSRTASRPSPRTGCGGTSRPGGCAASMRSRGF